MTEKLNPADAVDVMYLDLDGVDFDPDSGEIVVIDPGTGRRLTEKELKEILERYPSEPEEDESEKELKKILKEYPSEPQEDESESEWDESDFDDDDDPDEPPSFLDVQVSVSARNRDETRTVTLTDCEGRECSEELEIHPKHSYYLDILRRFVDTAGNMFEIPNPHPRDPNAPHWLIREIIRKAKEADEKAAESQRVTSYPGKTLAHLSHLNPQSEYLIPGLLRARQLALIGGQEKDCKTAVAIEMALSLATGTAFFGVLEVPRPARVGYMFGEGDEAEFYERCTRVAASKGLAPDAVLSMVVEPQIPNLACPNDLDGLVRFIDRHRLEVIFIDPIAFALAGVNTASLVAVGAILRNLISVCQRMKVTPIALHHTARRSRRRKLRPPDFHDLSGAGFSEFCRQWIMLGRREPYRPGTGLHRLWIVAAGSAGHDGVWILDISEGVGTQRHWSCKFQPVEGQTCARRRQSRVKRDMQAIWRALKEFPAGETKSVLKEKANLPNERFAKALDRLLKSKSKLQASMMPRVFSRASACLA